MFFYFTHCSCRVNLKPPPNRIQTFAQHAAPKYSSSTKCGYNIVVVNVIMSYELFNPSTELCRKFSRQSWAKALELAGVYGWKPMGTRPPSIHDFHGLNADWDGTYWTNDGQIVKTEDALALAQALFKSLDDIPDVNIEMDWNTKAWCEEDLPEWLSPSEKTFVEEGLKDDLLDIMGMHPFEYFAGDEKRHLTELIRFCRLGSFMIL